MQCDGSMLGIVFVKYFHKANDKQSEELSTQKGKNLASYISQAGFLSKALPSSAVAKCCKFFVN